MPLIRMIYVLLPCIDPDWDGTNTVHTDLQLFMIFQYVLKGAIFVISLWIYDYELTSSRAICNKKSKIEAVNKLIQDATTSKTKWLREWRFVPYAFRRYQSDDVTQWSIPNFCATKLCTLGQLRKSSVVTHFIHFSSTAKSHATSENRHPGTQLSRWGAD